MRGEKLLSIPDAVRWLEEELGLKRDRQSVYSWIYYGRQGIKLEAVSVCGKWHTSAQAIRRFLSAFTKQHSAEAGASIRVLEL